MNRKKVIIDKILSDKVFRELLLGMDEDLDRFIADPSCSCNIDVINKVDQRLAGTIDNDNIQNEWRVIDCDITELENLLRIHHRTGKRSFAIARDNDRIVCVLNENTGGNNG